MAYSQLRENAPLGNPADDDFLRPLSGALCTPGEALSTGYCKFNAIFSALFNFGLNVGIAYGTMKGVDHMGMFAKPNSPEAAGTPAAVDLFITCFFVCFLTSLLVTPGIKGEVQKGKLTPVRPETLGYGMYRFFPVRVENTWARAFWFAMEFELLFWAPSMVALAAACSGMEGDGDSVCHMSVTSYVYFKGVWCGLLAGVSYPFIMLGALNRRVIPEAVYDVFLEKKEAETAGNDTL